MNHGHRYKSPPVVEALCELFLIGSIWDDTVLGTFYERIKDQFPKKRQLQQFEAQVEIAGTGGATAGVRQGQPRMQFLTESGNRLVQVAENLLVVNQLTPYPHFEEWEPFVYSTLTIYRKLANPKAISKIGMRYINRVVIPKPRIQMEDYFKIYPQLPNGMGDEHGAFMVRVELPFIEKDHSVLMTFGTTPPQREQEIAYMLDLYDKAPLSKTTLNFDQLELQVRTAHQNIETAFEGSITDRLREVFEQKAKQ